MGMGRNIAAQDQRPVGPNVPGGEVHEEADLSMKYYYYYYYCYYCYNYYNYYYNNYYYY